MPKRPTSDKRPRKAQYIRKNLGHKDVEGLARKIAEKWEWTTDLNFFQVQAIEAQLLGKDGVVHARTGSGKTAIAAGPHVHEKSKGKVTIMVSPLIALQNEQVSREIITMPQY